MSTNHWDLEYAGSGACSGDFIKASYEHTSAGWVITYAIGGEMFTSSAAPRHPSLRMLGPDAAGEKRVIKTAFAVIDAIEAGVHAKARRDVRPIAKPRARRKVAAVRRATA